MERGGRILINSISNVSLSYLKLRWQNFDKTPKGKAVLIQETMAICLRRDNDR